MSSLPFVDLIRASPPRARTSFVAAAIILLVPATAWAQSSGAAGQTPPPQNPPITFQLPPLTVSAQKEPADPQTLPVSVTTVPGTAVQEAGNGTVSDAAIFAPNVHFTEFSARKLSNARFRGIGASPANPAITTYYDGVPLLHANASSLDLLHVAQVEFVRGPQSALFGRNTLGGVINVSSRRPALAGDWTGRATVPIASYDERGFQAEASGPVLGNRLGAGIAFQYLERDGFTRNVLTGNRVDDRSAYSGKAQLLWAPAARFEARVLVNAERADDGDYALSDLGGLRADPFETARDVEGFTERDIFSTTVLTRFEGTRIALSTTTGIVDWRSEDQTDLDYLPLPFATRRNREDSLQFTQEVRVASAANAPLRFSDRVALRWQAGVFLFTQDYEQDASNVYGPAFLGAVLAPLAGIPPELLNFSVEQQSPRAALDDTGIGVYGQGTVTVGDRLDLIAGLRADHERREAALTTFTTPAFAFFPPTSVDEERSFTDVSPQVAVAIRVRPDRLVYASAARGFKAGGFNASSPAGRESFDEEHTWSLEGGAKTTWAAGRVGLNAAVFRIDWNELQLNLPDPSTPAQFFIDNAGGASSTGAEVEVNVRARQGVDVFGSIGYTRARFDDGVVLGGVDVSGNEIPNTPDFTGLVGAQVTHFVRPGTNVFGRAEVAVHGAFSYNEVNTQGQDTYSLTNFRAGVHVSHILIEAWIRNAFDTKYIPVAFEYPLFAPSGFIGEMGRPRTFGVNLGVEF